MRSTTTVLVPCAHEEADTCARVLLYLKDAVWQLKLLLWVNYISYGLSMIPVATTESLLPHRELLQYHCEKGQLPTLSAKFGLYVCASFLNYFLGMLNPKM
jgi:hypothetical protein